MLIIVRFRFLSWPDHRNTKLVVWFPPIPHTKIILQVNNHFIKELDKLALILSHIIKYWKTYSHFLFSNPVKLLFSCIFWVRLNLVIKCRLLRILIHFSLDMNISSKRLPFRTHLWRWLCKTTFVVKYYSIFHSASLLLFLFLGRETRRFSKLSILLN